MIYSNIDYIPEFDRSKPKDFSYRKNRIHCQLNSSQDGRSLDWIWIDYNPEDNFSLYLLKKSLNYKTMFVYGSDGERIEFLEITRG